MYISEFNIIHVLLNILKHQCFLIVIIALAAIKRMPYKISEL